jgi:ferric-dicitrate binding protein FerR (iron transport regulator)
MDTRLSKAEWRLEALENSQRRQDDRMAALADRMDTHHREVMEAIGGLKDDRARAEGAAEARMADAQKTRDRMKAVSLILGVIATLSALGWINTSQGSELSWINASPEVAPPIPVQYHTRELP